MLLTAVYRSETVAVDVVQHVLYFEVTAGLEEKTNAGTCIRRVSKHSSATPECNDKVAISLQYCLLFGLRVRLLYRWRNIA
jgi:hypothetical protein